MLNLNDLRAESGEEPTGAGAGEQPREIDDLNAR
jgi:hypothetical protein